MGTWFGSKSLQLLESRKTVPGKHWHIMTEQRHTLYILQSTANTFALKNVRELHSRYPLQFLFNVAPNY